MKSFTFFFNTVFVVGGYLTLRACLNLGKFGFGGSGAAWGCPTAWLRAYHPGTLCPQAHPESSVSGTCCLLFFLLRMLFAYGFVRLRPFSFEKVRCASPASLLPSQSLVLGFCVVLTSPEMSWFPCGCVSPPQECQPLRTRRSAVLLTSSRAL